MGWVVGSQLHHVLLATGHMSTWGEVNGWRLGNEVVQVSCQSQVILMLLLCSLLCSLFLGFTGSLGFDCQITVPWIVDVGSGRRRVHYIRSLTRC